MAPSPLDAERRRSGLSARELTYALHKSKAHVEKLERFEKLLTQDPAFDHAEMYYLPRDEQYRRAIRMTARLESIACEQGFDYDDTELLRNVRVGFTGCAASTTLHTQMFIKNLGLLFSDEQKQRWMQLATEWRIVGCYAQTELGHGSNVRGLETTATFIRETDEFEIHTPSLRAYKWWPGALARTANVGVVYARLLIDGKDHGVHNFFVPLRDLDTHELKPGITTGDIGGKIGFQNVDNGWCRFDRVRIPRANMGNRFSTVDRDGTYRKITGVRQEILYFTMLQTRMEFVGLTGMALAKGCTIAVRYSAVREQGYDANEAAPTTELKVLDYQTQQYRLLPQLAAAYAITLSGHQVDLFRHDLARQIREGDLSMLDVGHAMSCGLKVFVSDAASNGIEVCRRACGGHGYLLASGLPVLLGDVVQTVTAEGENFVLTLQAGRSLLKTLATYRARGTLPRALAFLANVDKTPLASESLSCKTRWLDPAVYVAAFEQRFLYLLRDLERRVKTSSSIAAGVQNHSVACYKLSMAYGKLVIVQNFVAAVASREAFTRETLSNPKALEIVRLLCHLFALTQLETDAGEFMESGALRGEQLPLIRKNIEELLPQIRPHAVVLVDAFNFSDHSLNSALGRFDGNVYEALYVAAQHDPVNRASDKIALQELLVPIRQAVQKSRL